LQIDVLHEPQVAPERKVGAGVDDGSVREVRGAAGDRPQSGVTAPPASGAGGAGGDAAAGDAAAAVAATSRMLVSSSPNRIFIPFSSRVPPASVTRAEVYL
jgi:hypothetical protein